MKRAGADEGGGNIDMYAGIAHVQEQTCKEDNASLDQIAKLAQMIITFGSLSFPVIAVDRVPPHCAWLVVRLAVHCRGRVRVDAVPCRLPIHSV